jgi:hypothetical protein
MNAWPIKFNESKYKVMHIGKAKWIFKYQMDNSILSETGFEKDLDISVSINYE